MDGPFVIYVVYSNNRLECLEGRQVIPFESSLEV
jgi:hypothetical protein